MTPRQLVQLFALFCLAVIVALSLVTPSLRPVTALPHNLEHVAIFAITGVAVGLGYPKHWLASMLLLTIFAGGIELAQLYASGRHARLIDFVIDATAVCVGVVMAVIIERLTALRGLLDWHFG